MKEETRKAILDAIRVHPKIVNAAMTGSFARKRGNDEYSDLDLLIITRDLDEVRNVRSWLPQRDDVLISAFHFSHYCTVLLRGGDNIDLAIFSADEPPSRWVIHDYSVIKGQEGFEGELALAAKTTRDRAAHHNPDCCMDNVLLLLVTAAKRVGRGEELSAHAFIGTASETIIALARRQHGVEADADLLDPRRRVEQIDPELAHALHACVFVPPQLGVERLAQYVSTHHRQSMTREQKEVLDHLLGTKQW